MAHSYRPIRINTFVENDNGSAHGISGRNTELSFILTDRRGGDDLNRSESAISKRDAGSCGNGGESGDRSARAVENVERNGARTRIEAQKTGADNILTQIVRVHGQGRRVGPGPRTAYFILDIFLLRAAG